MTCQDSFHEVAFNISFWTRNISSARILFWRGVSYKNIEIPILQLMPCPGIKPRNFDLTGFDYCLGIFLTLVVKKEFRYNLVPFQSN